MKLFETARINDNIKDFDMFYHVGVTMDNVAEEYEDMRLKRLHEKEMRRLEEQQKKLIIPATTELGKKAHLVYTSHAPFMAHIILTDDGWTGKNGEAVVNAFENNNFDLAGELLAMEGWKAEEVY